MQRVALGGRGHRACPSKHTLDGRRPVGSQFSVGASSVGWGEDPLHSQSCVRNLWEIHDEKNSSSFPQPGMALLY